MEDKYISCSGCGLVFNVARPIESEHYESHDCDTDDALYLATDN